jgi:mitochondrial fission protein ELM1
MSENSENPSFLSEDGALTAGSDYPAPRIAVLLGGRSGYFDFPTGWYSAAYQYLSQIVNDLGGSLVLLASEETPGFVFDAPATGADQPPQINIAWEQSQQGLYRAHYEAVLAWSDGFVVTPDNMSMAQDACDSGKPVFLTGGDLAKGRLFSFYRKLKQDGCLRPLDELNSICSA